MSKSPSLLKRIYEWAGPVHLIISLCVFAISAGAYYIKNTRSGSYAAISISRSEMKINTSNMQSSRIQANYAALRTCREEEVQPQDCQIAIWFVDACGAIATDSHMDGGKNGAWGAAWAGTIKIAEETALENCKKYSRKETCAVAESLCSY